MQLDWSAEVYNHNAVILVFTGLHSHFTELPRLSHVLYVAIFYIQIKRHSQVFDTQTFGCFGAEGC